MRDPENGGLGDPLPVSVCFRCGKVRCECPLCDPEKVRIYPWWWAGLAFGAVFWAVVGWAIWRALR